MHLVGLFYLSFIITERNPKHILLWQWCSYMVFFCSFHLLEFFVTAIYNPTQVDADSFLVNHSTAYTAAFFGSLTEFWFRFWFAPSFNVSPSVVIIGLLMVVPSQALRSTAMMTAGESFNHYIQTTKKDNHILVTKSVYKYIRHPSYTGFYCWCIGCQLVLGNRMLAIGFAIIAWKFFERRIKYEEESLCRFFPYDYPQYVATSYTGIPFLFTKVDYTTCKQH